MSGWQQIEIAGRPADVFEPAESQRAARAILFLHDFDAQTLRESAVFTAELERAGLALRDRDAGDRRVVRLRLTGSGRELEPRLRALVLKMQEDALSGVPDEALTGLYRTLERIVENLSHSSDSIK